jgi:amino acid transporter
MLSFFPHIVQFSLYRVAWLIGWALILEYTIGGSAVARGISPNLVSGIAPASGLFFMGHIEQELIFLNSLSKLNEK